MNALQTSELSELAGLSEDRFYVALSKVPVDQVYRGVRGAELVVQVVHLIEENGLLSEQTKATRVQMILERLKLDERGLERLAEHAVAMTPVVRNTIATKLPAILKIKLARPSIKPSDNLQPAKQPKHDAIWKSASPLIDERTEGQVDVEMNTTKYSDYNINEEVADAGTVAILSKGDLQESNKSLLASKKIGSFVWDTVEKLKEELIHSSDICAFIIDESFIQELDKDMQQELFRRIAEYSSFLWIRIHDTGCLRITHPEIRQIIRSEWCLSNPVPGDNLSFRQGRNIQASELLDVQHVLRTIRAKCYTAMICGEISEEESLVLTAAVCLDAQSSRLDGTPVIVKKFSARFLAGGRSNARLAVIQVDGHKRPVIAKIDKRTLLSEEIKR